MHFKFKSLSDILITVTAGLLNCQSVFQRFVLGSNPKEITFVNKWKQDFFLHMLTIAQLSDLQPWTLGDLKTQDMGETLIAYLMERREFVIHIYTGHSLTYLPALYVCPGYICGQDKPSTCAKNCMCAASY